VSALSPAPDRDPRLPLVAIVGRTNVGKSTLFNRLVRDRRAIVDDAPGVTRDRVVAEVAHAGRRFLCIDTGGIVVEPPRDPAAMTARVREQTLAALAEADCVVCVFDGAAGLAPEDRETARLLRESGKRVVWAVNKLDTAGREGLLHDFHPTGARDLLPISGAHGRGIPALLDAIVAALPEAPGAGTAEPPRTRLALIGRPNVGKSSLLNRLLGEDRVIVAPEPGTTRDTVDTPIRAGGRAYVLIDTAGIRRRGRVREPLERHGAVRALGTLGRTDLALVVLDASEGLTDQDARIVGRAWEAGRGVILLANKWDLVPRARRDAATFRADLAAAHPAFAGLPLLCVSARSGEGLADLFPLVARVERAYGASLPTPALNRELRAAVTTTPPPSPGGRAIRLFYATQTAARPPTVTVFASAPALIPPAYARYLAKRWTTAFRLVGVPLRLRFRDRREAPSGARERGTPGRARRSSRPSRGGGRSPRR
jgi:GTP-binding protein